MEFWNERGWEPKTEEVAEEEAAGDGEATESTETLIETTESAEVNE